MPWAVSGRDTPPAGKAGRRMRVLAWSAIAAGIILAAVWIHERGKPDPAAEEVKGLRAQAGESLAAGNHVEAERALERWQDLRPDDLEARRLLMDVRSQLGRLPEAIDDAREVLRLEPDAHDVRERLALWLFRVGRIEEADAECRRCQSARPNDLQLRFLQAEISRSLGNNAEAERLVDSLLQVQPGSAPALTLRGALYLDAGQPDRAVPLLRTALSQGGPGQRRARHFLSLALVRTGREEEARQVMAEVRHQQTLELWDKYGRSDSSAYQLSLAESLLQTGRTAEAVDMLERLIARSPDCGPAHRLLAQHFEAQGQVARAAEHRRRAGD